MEEAEAVLPVGPWALAAVATVLLVALSVPPGGPRAAHARARAGGFAGPVGLVLAVAAVLAARLGPDSDLRNPVPALVVGLGWPLLLLLPGSVGLVRPQVERPGGVGAADSDARPAHEAPAPTGTAPADDAPRPGGTAPADARPAVLAALAVAAFLVLPTTPTRPAAVGAAVAAYAVAVAAACVAFGRRTVAARGEVLGLLASWAAVGRRLPSWAAPRGALAVLAVVLGGAWFERYERSTAWVQGLPVRDDVVVGLLVSLAAAGLGAAALHAATRRLGPGAAAAVLLPLALATAAAGVLRRALISAQLLADQALGGRAVDPDPLGVSGGQALALAVVAAGGALSGAVLARRAGEGAARLPGVAVLLLLTGASAWVVLQP